VETLYIESAYENAIVALGTQLCTSHLTAMTSSEIRHYEIWIYHYFVLFNIVFLLLILFKVYSSQQ